MGDTYCAASGVLPLDPAAPPELPALHAQLPPRPRRRGRLPAHGRHLRRGRHRPTTATRSTPAVPPQLDALSRRTRLVTMTIGGNDSNVFICSILACGAAGARTLGQGNPCKDQYGEQFTDTIRRTTYPASSGAARRPAPRAPRPDRDPGLPLDPPAGGGCYPTDARRQRRRALHERPPGPLNDAVRRAARATGATYVNMNKVSEGHDACQPIGTRWVEPVTRRHQPRHRAPQRPRRGAHGAAGPAHPRRAGEGDGPHAALSERRPDE